MSNLENWHRRQALALASQLPDNANDALLVIEATREIVERFLICQSRSSRFPKMC
jgi:hypothetical protein